MAHRKLLVAVTVLLAAGLAGVAGAEEDLSRGAETYQLCAQCHGVAGAGDALALAPAIAGMDAWYVEGQLRKFQQGYRGTHFDDLAGMRMRPMAISLMKRSEEAGGLVPKDDEITAVSAYVASLDPADPEPTLSGGDATRGQALYGPCTACHAVDGAGNEPLGGAPLANQHDWYLLRQLEGFKSGVRGWRSDDVQGGMMRGMVSTLPDEQAMKDVIAYIQTLGGGE